MTSRVLVTGGSGFIGTYLCEYLRSHDYQVRKAVRKPEAECAFDQVAVGDIDGKTNWKAALHGCDYVVHLAARVHIMNDTTKDPLYSFRQTNTQGTRNLAEQAVNVGVKRIVYLSSIKVNGEETLTRPFAADDMPNPMDPYAISKHEAEMALIAACEPFTTEYSIIRPPLVYGPGVKGNFRRLIRLIQRGIPLPFGSIRNSRSMVSLRNLCNLIELCLSMPAAANQVFLVSDKKDWSTPELLRSISANLGNKLHIFPFPPGLLHILGILTGQSNTIRRLTGSLRLDVSKTSNLLGWEPIESPKDGIESTVRYELENLG